MERTNKTMLHMLYWILGVIAAAIIAFVVFITFIWGAGGLVTDRDISLQHNALSMHIPRELTAFLLQGVYLAGIVYILVLLMIMLRRVLRGHIYEKIHLRYIRRIGYMLLLSPLVNVLFAICFFLPFRTHAGTGVMMILDSFANYWPYAIAGLAVLSIGEVYKVGIGYRQELELTV